MINRRPGASCEKCPLSLVAHVMDHAPKNPDVVVVAPYPTSFEAHQGPATGDANEYVVKSLRRQGYKRIAWVYVLPCRMPDNPSEALVDRALHKCSDVTKLLADVSVETPILALGGLVSRVLGLTGTERWQQLGSGHWALAIISPAGLYATPGAALRVAWGIAKFLSPRKDIPGVVETRVYTDTLPDLDIFAHGTDLISFDLETTGLDWRRNELLWIGFAAPATTDGNPTEVGTRVVVIDGKLLTKEWLEELFHKYGHRLGGHNVKFDCGFLAYKFGLDPDLTGRVSWDTILMAKQLNEHYYKGLKDLSRVFFNADDYDAAVEPYTKGVNQGRFDLIPQDELIEYLAYDVHYTLLLFHALKEALPHRRWRLYNDFEMPLFRELHHIEVQGIPINTQRLEALRVKMEDFLEEKKSQIEAATDGRVVNPNSAPQVAKYFYDVKKYPLRRIYKAPPRTTNDQALEELLAEVNDPVIPLLQEQRRVSTLYSTYVKATKAAEVNGRVSTSFKQAHVVTGRLSAENVPIQTWPRPSDEWAVGVRELIDPGPGMILLAVDGSQWELRVAAAWSQDPVMVETYQKGEDIHGAAADVFFGKGQWTKEQRAETKRFIFGWLYGGTAESSSQVFSLPIDVKRQIVARFNNSFETLITWRDRLFTQAATKGHIDTPLGFTHHYPVVGNHNRRDIEKYAVNWPVQGTASNLICQAGFKIGPKVRRFGGQVLLYKHDEIVVAVQREDRDIIARMMIHEIESAAARAFPIIPWVAEAEWGYNWGDLQPLHYFDP